MIRHKMACTLDRQGGAHHTLGMDLLGGNFCDALLNRYGRLREPENDRVKHGRGTLTQGGLVQLSDGIWGLGNDHIGASLGRRYSTREVGKRVSSDHNCRDATLFECGRDVATPRRARASVTGGSDHHIHALGQIVEAAP